MSGASIGTTSAPGLRLSAFLPRVPRAVRDLTFFWQLATIFALVFVGAAFGIGILAQRERAGAAAAEGLGEAESPGLALALSAEGSASSSAFELREAAAAGQTGESAQSLARYAERRDEAARAASQYAGLAALSAEAHALATAESAAFDSVASAGDAIASAIRGGASPATLAPSLVLLRGRLASLHSAAAAAAAGHRERSARLAEQVRRAATSYMALMWFGLGGFLLVGLVVSGVLSREYAGPLGRLARVSERIAQGDLAVEAVRLERGDEIGRLGASFDRMVPYLRDMLSRIQALSRELAENAAAISRAGGETVESLAQLNAAIEQITAGAQEQAHSSQESAEVVLEMSASIQSVAGGAAEIAGGTGRAMEVARRGGETVEAAIAGMQEMRQSVVDAATLVGELGERTARIGSIVEVISQIAARTNLLALNAAIEAARAGEHGRGFAVVADEVRKLADGSQKSAAEIAGLVQGIQEGARRAVEGMEAGMARVEREATRAQAATQALADILAAVEDTGRRVGHISEDAARLSERADRVTALVQDVASVAQESAASAEEMGAQSLQVAATMESIASPAEVAGGASATARLQHVAGQLQELAAEFRV